MNKQNKNGGEKLQAIIYSLIVSPFPRSIRLAGGLALAARPSVTAGAYVLTISRIENHPSTQELTIVKNALRAAVGASVFGSAAPDIAEPKLLHFINDNGRDSYGYRLTWKR